MPEQAQDKRPHLVPNNTSTPQPFTAPSAGGGGSPGLPAERTGAVDDHRADRHHMAGVKTPDPRWVKQLRKLIALNFLQHLSGIATETRRYVEACGDSGAMIVDTRKTTPGLRMLEKYAVTVGGGQNHRFGLNSMILIKDNHIRAAGGISPAVRLVRAKSSPFLKIEVETEDLLQVREALAAGVDVIMLDNMPTERIAEAVRVINGQALVEVSGKVTYEQIETLAGLGVDIISSGALTHSVKAVDISLKFE